MTLVLPQFDGPITKHLIVDGNNKLCFTQSSRTKSLFSIFNEVFCFIIRILFFCSLHSYVQTKNEKKKTLLVINKRLFYCFLYKHKHRSHFLPNRVFSEWNGLSEEIVNASNPNIFKNKLDAHFDDEVDRFRSQLQFYIIIIII
jgi:hypothetical protein